MNKIDISLLNDMFYIKNDRLYYKMYIGGKSVKDNEVGNISDGYRKTKIKGKKFAVHRIIWAMYYNKWTDGDIDHIDGNGLNNAIENLRDATTSQNMMNRVINSNNKSGIKGVSWDKVKEKWRAQICINRKVKYLGLFSDIKDAECAVKCSRRNLHGEFYNDG